jgi:hypothetical protein
MYFLGSVIYIWRWIRDHPILLALTVTAYFSVFGLIHIKMRLPASVAIQNGWLDIEDLLSIGIALPRAWILLSCFIVVLVGTAIIEYIFHRIFRSNKVNEHILLISEEINSLSNKPFLFRYLGALISLSITILFFFVGSLIITQKYYPWPYAGVVTHSKVAYGTMPNILEYKDFIINETTLVHLITLNNWVIFQYIEDKNLANDKKPNKINSQNWGNLKKKGYIAFPSSSIDTVFFENRSKLDTSGPIIGPIGPGRIKMK